VRGLDYNLHRLLSQLSWVNVCEGVILKLSGLVAVICYIGIEVDRTDDRVINSNNLSQGTGGSSYPVPELNDGWDETLGLPAGFILKDAGTSRDLRVPSGDKEGQGWGEQGEDKSPLSPCPYLGPRPSTGMTTRSVDLQFAVGGCILPVRCGKRTSFDLTGTGCHG